MEFSDIYLHLTREPADFLPDVTRGIEDQVMLMTRCRSVCSHATLLSLLLAGACSHPHVSKHYHSSERDSVHFVDFRPEREEKVQRKQVITKAISLLDGRVALSRNQRFDANPLGFVRSAYWEVGVEILSQPAKPGERGLENLLRSAEQKRQIFHGVPRVGDLVLFKKPAKATELGDGTETKLGHVAIVEGVMNDGTLALIGRFRRGPARFKVNIQQTSTIKTTNGTYINDIVKVGSEFPAGELFYAFVDPWS